MSDARDRLTRDLADRSENHDVFCGHRHHFEVLAPDPCFTQRVATPTESTERHLTLLVPEPEPGDQ